MKYKNLINNILYPLLSLLMIILLWFIAAKAVNIELIIPSIKSTFTMLFKLFAQKNFYKSVAGTLYRTLISFSISLTAALILAVASVFAKPVYKLLSPMITVARAIPTMSVILLTIVWLKPDTSPLLVAFLIIFPIMYSNFYTAIISIDRDLTQMSKAYKVSNKDMIFSLYLPSIAPNFFDIVRSSISLSVKLIISAEVLAQTKNSMGVMMQIAKSQLDTANLLAWTIIAILLSYLLEFIVYLIKKSIVRWQNGT